MFGGLALSLRALLVGYVVCDLEFPDNHDMHI